MKVKTLLEIVDDGWVAKPKGFRVLFQKYSEDGVVDELLPDETDNPFDSDVTAWRAAWKLAAASRPDLSAPTEDSYFNIRVVNDQGEPVKYYATNRMEVFNPINTSNDDD